MERLKKIVEELRSRSSPVIEQEILNTLREYLQVIVVKLIYQSRYGDALSFMGGTCLRICYNLKRYSEDLDFSLDGPQGNFSFRSLIEHLARELKLLGFDLSTSVKENKTVRKSFLGFAGFHRMLGLGTFREGQKLHIKIEADANPPPLTKGGRESFFVNRFQEVFPILKHSLPALFAGKIAAILQRPYACGRDYYDLIWYLGRKTEPDLNYLNRAVKGKNFAAWGEVVAALKRQVQNMKPSDILNDIGGFLEDPTEAQWILRYQELFDQLTAGPLEKHGSRSSGKR